MKQLKVQGKLNIKLLLLGFFLLFLLLFIIRSSYSSSPQNYLSVLKTAPLVSSTCTKIPAALAEAIVHYTTSNVTPQQTLAEVSVTARVLQRRSPCNFLVFGLGHDSLMWAALNHGGRTVFFEEDAEWIRTVTGRFPSLVAHHVSYDTHVHEAEGLLEHGRRPECKSVGDGWRSGCRLALSGLPAVFDEVEWDVVMVDAPTGWVPDAPGRMGAIYTAGMSARGRRGEGETDVFVHDVDRTVEDQFSKLFLCEAYLKEQVGRLRHFTIPSHRTGTGIPFCP